MKPDTKHFSCVSRGEEEQNTTTTKLSHVRFEGDFLLSALSAGASKMTATRSAAQCLGCRNDGLKEVHYVKTCPHLRQI